MTKEAQRDRARKESGDWAGGQVEGQRSREMDKEKVRQTEVPRHIGRNEDRDREMRVREAETYTDREWERDGEMERGRRTEIKSERRVP